MTGERRFELISPINLTARDWAAEHGGELWSNVSEETRGKIRQIIARSFEGPTALEEVIGQICSSGQFSRSLASTIARTEIRMAQVRSQFEAWQKSGIVQKVKWLPAKNPCKTCSLNAGLIRKVGGTFPSGHVAPLAHIDCECMLLAVEFSDLD